MDAGRLNLKVTFQVEALTADDAGGNSAAWSDVWTDWGELLELRGRERLAQGTLTSEVGAVLRVRSATETRTIVAGKHRVLIGIDQAPYQIRTIGNPDQRDHYLEMIVERGVGT